MCVCVHLRMCLCVYTVLFSITVCKFLYTFCDYILALGTPEVVLVAPTFNCESCSGKP